MPEAGQLVPDKLPDRLYVLELLLQAPGVSDSDAEQTPGKQDPGAKKLSLSVQDAPALKDAVTVLLPPSAVRPLML